MTIYLQILSNLMIIGGIVLVSFSVNKLVKNTFKNMGGYSTDWITLQKHWIDCRKFAFSGIIIIIIGFILQIVAFYLSSNQ